VVARLQPGQIWRGVAILDKREVPILGDATATKVLTARRTMVEIIVSEHQLACLKAAVPKGSIEYAALEAGEYFAGDEIAPGPIAVTFTCSLDVAQQLLAIARASCPDVATGIRAAIDQQTH
jgi:hypothetical protein